MAAFSSAESPFGSSHEIIAQSTRPNGIVVLNADDLISPHIKSLKAV
jgi:hypothetical protein